MSGIAEIIHELSLEKDVERLELRVLFGKRGGIGTGPVFLEYRKFI